MTVMQFLKQPGWDSPFYKILARNDTGSAAGHQAGVVVPKSLREYLPGLEEGLISQDKPTTDRQLEALLYLGMEFKAQVVTRYQVQTWGGKRTPEARITDQLSPIRDHAEGDDVLVLQRRLDSVATYRFLLFRRSAREFEQVQRLLAEEGERWGVIKGFDPPLAQGDLDKAEASIEELGQTDFKLFSHDQKRVETTTTRIARSMVFRRNILRAYDQTCAVSGIRLTLPPAQFEVDAAHIVPVSRLGSDDPRNGLALCKTVHWAFDRGLITLTDDYLVHLAEAPSNEWLKQFRGKEIKLPGSEKLRPSAEALRWHRENVFADG